MVGCSDAIKEEKETSPTTIDVTKVEYLVGYDALVNVPGHLLG